MKEQHYSIGIFICLFLGALDIFALNYYLFPKYISSQHSSQLLANTSAPPTNTSQDANVIKMNEPEKTPPTTSAANLPPPSIPSTKTSVKKALPEVKVVYFAKGSAKLRFEEQENLEEVRDLLQENPSWSVRLEGHADQSGGERFNKPLSTRRASVIADVLISYRIDSTRIITKSFGSQRPVILGRDEASLSQNRRVEIHFFDTLDETP